MQFMAFVGWLAWAGSSWAANLRSAFFLVFNDAFRRSISPLSLLATVREALIQVLSPLLPLAVLLVCVTLAFQLLVTGFGLSVKNLAPKFDRLMPGTKLKGLVRQNIPALVQAALLLPIFGYTVYTLVRAQLPQYFALPVQDLTTGLNVVTGSIQGLLWKASGAFVVMGLVNMFRQRRQYSSDLKMSKHEVKEEAKQTDGNPHIKARVRRLQRDLRRRSMMKDVAKATAVVVNPTHYAVAIRYKMSSMAAPTVVGKGKNYIALRIRQIANDHQIPIVENPPLAQALYKSAEVGQEIPAHLYKAVAEILAYIYRIMKGRLPGQED